MIAIIEMLSFMCACILQLIGVLVGLQCEDECLRQMPCCSCNTKCHPLDLYGTIGKFAVLFIHIIFWYTACTDKLDNLVHHIVLMVVTVEVHA